MDPYGPRPFDIAAAMEDTDAAVEILFSSSGTPGASPASGSGSDSPHGVGSSGSTSAHTTSSTGSKRTRSTTSGV